jgi:hypothetical protein
MTSWPLSVNCRSFVFFFFFSFLSVVVVVFNGANGGERRGSVSRLVIYPNGKHNNFYR